MQIYRIGPARGAQRVGYARDPEALRAKMQESGPVPLTISVWDVPTGQAMLAERLFRIRQAARAKGDGWFEMTPASADANVEAAIEDTSPARVAVAAEVKRGDHAAAMLYLRTKVFETTQDMMGLIVGRSAAIVSRWEAGATTPGLDELLRLRAYALAVGIPWEDSLLLDPPKP